MYLSVCCIYVYPFQTRHIYIYNLYTYIQHYRYWTQYDGSVSEAYDVSTYAPTCSSTDLAKKLLSSSLNFEDDNQEV